MSKVSRYDDISIYRELVIIDKVDKQSEYKKYEKQMAIWLASADDNAEDNADICFNTMVALDRPWEEILEKKKLRYTADDLMQIYAERFPEELTQE